MDMSDLSDAEIVALPLELRVCFHLRAWNHAATDIVDIDSWARTFGFVPFGEPGMPLAVAVAEAKSAAQRLLEFVKSEKGRN